MSPSARTLCKSIHSILNVLPAATQDELTRAYAKTWSLVVLVRDGLAAPSKTSWDRLKAFWDAIAAEHTKWVQATPRIK